MATTDLTCQQLVELVTDYLEEALPTGERARFDAHIATCANCRAYLDQLRQTIRLTGRLSEEAIPPPARDRLLLVFRQWRAGQGDSAAPPMA